MARSKEIILIGDVQKIPKISYPILFVPKVHRFQIDYIYDVHMIVYVECSIAKYISDTYLLQIYFFKSLVDVDAVQSNLIYSPPRKYDFSRASF